LYTLCFWATAVPPPPSQRRVARGNFPSTCFPPLNGPDELWPLNDGNDLTWHARVIVKLWPNLQTFMFVSAAHGVNAGNFKPRAVRQSTKYAYKLYECRPDRCNGHADDVFTVTMINLVISNNWTNYKSLSFTGHWVHGSSTSIHQTTNRQTDRQTMSWSHNPHHKIASNFARRVTRNSKRNSNLIYFFLFFFL